MQGAVEKRLVAHWYAVRTKPRQESTAVEHLERQRFELYFPRILKTRRQRGRCAERVEPLFPNYLFVRTDPEQCDLSPIRSTRGVVGLVRFGQRIIPVPDTVIEAMRSTEDAEGYAQLGARVAYRKGDVVQILEGPLAGLEAIFESGAGEQRALILLEALGQLSRVYIEKDHLGHAT